MNFKPHRRQAEPEVNLIPLIDVVLVIIIFLMLTTTFSKISSLEINLPSGEAALTEGTPNEVVVEITASGDVIVNRVLVGDAEVLALAAAIAKAVPEGRSDPVVIINADAKAAHQRVIDVMQAAQRAGLSHISFAIQTPGD